MFEDRWTKIASLSCVTEPAQPRWREELEAYMRIASLRIYDDVTLPPLRVREGEEWDADESLIDSPSPTLPRPR